jgi:hypothetical protein
VLCEFKTMMPLTAAFEPLMPTASSAVNAAHNPVPRWLNASCKSGTALNVPVPSVGNVEESEAAAGASGTIGTGVSAVPLAYECAARYPQA